MKTLVLGMGNPILGDDGIGLVVARALEGKAADSVVATSTMIGLDLMDIMTGYDRVFVIDAMCTREGEPGEVRRISPEGGPGTMHLFTSHGLHFFEIIDLGRSCGIDMPEIGAVYGIEIGDAVCFDEELSDGLKDKLDGIVEIILRDMG
ncbi:MAG TPA: hydrogenase maturation protease [Deltaproteobacteria bacterium]|nr:hydrogenase maturation protease [Deltaproteobacteria bacterium]HPR54503.1 hydrogenase maturation protease [Deltaproteobacteria bacterium]HXK46611.1 hydrogenase maturation protease [Deltaproteobacteria bacterium]